MPLFGLAVPSEPRDRRGLVSRRSPGTRLPRPGCRRWPVEPLVRVGELGGEPQLPGLVEPLEGHPGWAQVGAVELDPPGWRGAADVGGAGPDA